MGEDEGWTLRVADRQRSDLQSEVLLQASQQREYPKETHYLQSQPETESVSRRSREESCVTAVKNSDVNPNRKISIHKYRKKQAANDSQLLLNRIALLQKEEERARRKVDQTKHRALDILALREENELRTKEWMDAAANEQRMREEIYRKNAEMEEQSRIVKKKQLDAVFRKKKQDVDHVRDEKMQLREEMLRMKELDIKRKQQMRTEIRIREEEARKKREEEKRLHDQRIREYYERKAKQEEAEALKAEKLVKRLERKEKEWIDKLRNAQQIQENAYNELESALTLQAQQSPTGQHSHPHHSAESFGSSQSNHSRNHSGNTNQLSGGSPGASGSLSQRDEVRQKSSTRRGKKPQSS